MKKIIVSLTILFFIVNAYGQNTLMTIDQMPISKEEFIRTYLKNNIQDKITEEDLNNYLNLFINFKLKVHEAVNLGYDTTQSYKDEYNMYLGQLAEPFFTDTALQSKLLKEAYKRSKKEIRLSYIILIAPTSDSAKVGEKAREAYSKAIKGTDFQTLVQEYSDSKQKQFDKGDAWYNGVLRMPYEIENFAYNNPIGSISKPIYANNAFFILKITGERTAPKRVRASHIYVRLSLNPSEKDSLAAFRLIDTIKQQLENGVAFEKVAERYSQDKATSVKGGDVGWFSTGRMFRSFENATYKIDKIGDYVGPIRTPAGYHFIKLTGRETYGTFDQEEKGLLELLKKSDRYDLVKNSIYNKLKKEYNYKKVGSLDDFYTKIDSTIFQKKWHDTIFRNDTRVLATFADKKLTYSDFAKYLSENQNIIRQKVDMKPYINDKFNEFIKAQLKAYEITQLPSKNEDFKNLITEYHDGLLLFDITNDKVWQKAIKDTTGLKNYYLQHKNNYYQKLDLVVYTYKDEKSKKKVLKYLKKKKNKNYSDTAIVELCNKKGDISSIELNGIFKEGDNDEVDYIIGLMKNNKIAADQNIVVDTKNKKIIYIKDNYYLIKGLVTADYQNLLEKEWLDQLHKKYKVEVNQDVWEKLKKELINK